jgi:hypothetical protein
MQPVAPEKTCWDTSRTFLVRTNGRASRPSLTCLFGARLGCNVIRDHLGCCEMFRLPEKAARGSLAEAVAFGFAVWLTLTCRTS